MMAEELIFKVVKIQDNKVTLALENQQLTISRRFLPAQIQEGDILSAELLTEEMKKARQKNLARAVLNEILNGK